MTKPVNKARVVNKVLVVFGSLVFLPLSIPILGTFCAWTILGSLDCGLTAAGGEDCYLLGLNIGQRMYGYAIPLVGSFLTPVAFIMGFWDLFLVWICAFSLTNWWAAKINESAGDLGTQQQ